MGKTTGISWSDATFNPWRCCVEVSPACDNTGDGNTGDGNTGDGNDAGEVG